MKTKLVDSIVSNEEHVRLRIFDGEFTPDEALSELLRIEKAQHESTRRIVSEQRAQTALLSHSGANVAGEAVEKADYKIGWWLSAALEDSNVCAEMKADIRAWFEAHQPGLSLASERGE